MSDARSGEGAAPAAAPTTDKKPSLRLTLSTASLSAAAHSSGSGAGNAGAGASTAAYAPATQVPAPKRRRYAPVPLVPDSAGAAQLTVLHQQTALHFVLDQPVGSTAAPRWHARGRTVLYVVRADDADAASAGATASTAAAASGTLPLALHLKSTCAVREVRVAHLDASSSKLQDLRTSYHHADPLKYVLQRPTAAYSVPEDPADAAADATDPHRFYRFHADAQSARGGAGMATALRAAAVAANLGELRIAAERPQPPVTAEGVLSEQQLQDRQNAWRQDLERWFAAEKPDETNGPSTVPADGCVPATLREELGERSTERRRSRLQLVSKRLAQAGSSALRIIVVYDVALPHGVGAHHLAGLHLLAALPNPHVYTTTGVFGDHGGPRAWVPCCDSAAVRHRATQELSVQVTAPMGLGLSIAGAGEDFGGTRALLLNRGDWSFARTAEALGHEHAALLEHVWSAPSSSDATLDRSGNHRPDLHVIPIESHTESLASLQTSVVWRSATWSPVPVRCLGFAIGPFKMVDDPEYFNIQSLSEISPSDDNGDDDNDHEKDEGVSPEEKRQAFQEAARRNGEGIRQVYFAPLYERKFIHQYADQRLLSETKIVLVPLTKDQRDMSEKFDQTVTHSTTGVTHRALSLMRDILAVPAFRTVSCTQIWIPDAIDGGVTCGALHACPEVLLNPFLGGAIMDARLLPPLGAKLPFHGGGRVLQFVQARSAIRGWINAALPLGGDDDVGNGYIHSTIESFLVSLYERGHGAYGEGGGRAGTFFSKRFAGGSGLNSPNLDFLPIQNIEELDAVTGAIGSVPIDERHNDHLWRSHRNGTESHTGALDEFNVRQLLIRDAVEAIERGTEKDATVPHPTMGWFGSHLSLSYFSSNATTSSGLGCGAIEMQNPVGGLVYRTLKSDAFRAIVEARAGTSNFIRLLRVAFIASHLDDIGEAELRFSLRRDKKADSDAFADAYATDFPSNSPPFVVCVNEILKKKGLSHNLFARALQNLSGPLKEHFLIGSLVDVERHAEDPRTQRPFVEPEAFPNSFVRGSSLLYCRVGVHIETSKESGAAQAQVTGTLKGVQMQAYAEPIIPEGGIAFGGPITMRVVENEGQFREYIKDLDVNGSRRDWGSMFLHAKPVTTTKEQTAASGAIEGGGAPKESEKTLDTWTAARVPSLETSVPTKGFNEDNFHTGGYQAIELIRLTNLSPLLWVRVDPSGMFGGRISVFQPDACLAECIYHDGDAAAQVDAIRFLAERPLRIQSASKFTTLFDVNVAELPVRVLGDCLRGSATVHSSLPHTPVVRAHAALAIGQWQNNKAPKSKDDVGADNWVGLSLLFQYFNDRFYRNGVIMPVKFSRLSVKKSQGETQTTPNAADGGGAISKNDDNYQYLDSLVEEEERATILDDAEEIELEEDEEYRVRSHVVSAVAAIRAGDGQTPATVIEFLEKILESDDAELLSNLIYPDEELIVEQTLTKGKSVDLRQDEEDADEGCEKTPILSYVSSSLIADSLLSLCYINASPSIILDPATGKSIQASGSHPVSKLIEITRSWLNWELYREKIREEVLASSATGISGNSHNLIAPNAVLALVNLAILRQSTSNSLNGLESKGDCEVASVKFYMDIFEKKHQVNDLTRAACAQAITSLYCAADRFSPDISTAVGLLSALEFLLNGIVDDHTSPSLQETLALLMMDASTGKVCSMNRVGVIGGRNDLVASASRFMTGPLGASHGGDNGSAVLTTVSATLSPAANAVNDGARRGLRLLSRAGHPRETVSQEIIARIALFATRLWRTINGEPADALEYRPRALPTGACTYNPQLRCSLLALWQWIWPKGCFAVLAVQSWPLETHKSAVVRLVMQSTEEEKTEGAIEEAANEDINQIIAMELDRQAWRGEMARKAYDMFQASKGSIQDAVKAEQGIGVPLPPIERDASFRQGGWIASAAQQRRKLALDGGGAVTKLRLTVKNPNET